MTAFDPVHSPQRMIPHVRGNLSRQLAVRIIFADNATVLGERLNCRRRCGLSGRQTTVRLGQAASGVRAAHCSGVSGTDLPLTRDEEKSRRFEGPAGQATRATRDHESDADQGTGNAGVWMGRVVWK